MWQNYNFAGTIDWAVDLQAFSGDDMEHIPDRPKFDKGCVSGEQDTINTASLCALACSFGFCPETLCTCTEHGDLIDLPKAQSNGNIEAWIPSDVDLSRLCKFACKYGYCPEDVCYPRVVDEVVDENNYPNAPSDEEWDSRPSRDKYFRGTCELYKGISNDDRSIAQCKIFCNA